MEITVARKQRAAAAPLLRSIIIDLDAGVPDIDQLVYRSDGRPMHGVVTYAYYVHKRPPPPAPRSAEFIEPLFNPNVPVWLQYIRDLPADALCSTWAEFGTLFLAALPYRSLVWKYYHDIFLAASFTGKAIGVSDYGSPKEAFDEMRHGRKQENDPWRLYVMSRGVYFEPFINALYTVLHRPVPIILKTDGGTMLHPTEIYAIATRDAGTYNAVTLEFIRNNEWKSPKYRDAFLEVPPDYMVQVQQTMCVTGATVCDFGSLWLNDSTFESEFVVIRVYRNDNYINAMMTAGKLFCRCVLTDTPPPPRGFIALPPVRTEMIVRVKNVVGLVAGGVDMIRTGIEQAHAESKRK